MQSVIRFDQGIRNKYLDNDSALVRYNTRMTISRNVTKSVTQMTTQMSRTILDDIMKMLSDDAKRR